MHYIINYSSSSIPQIGLLSSDFLEKEEIESWLQLYKNHGYLKPGCILAVIKNFNDFEENNLEKILFGEIILPGDLVMCLERRNPCICEHCSSVISYDEEKSYSLFNLKFHTEIPERDKDIIKYLVDQWENEVDITKDFHKECLEWLKVEVTKW